MKTATGEGVYTWTTPAEGGVFTLTHRTTKGDAALGETLTATFAVPARPGEVLGVALDNADLVFRTDGAVPWFRQTGAAHTGGSAARSCAVGDGEASHLETTVSGAGTLAFWWKVSSEEGYDALTVFVDGEEKARLSGERGWEQRTIAVSGEGTHRVVWTYAKDGSASRGDDAGWVDAVVWTPRAAVAPPAPSIADAAWTLERAASAAAPSILASPDGTWRLRAAVAGRTAYVSFYNPFADDEDEDWEFKNCVVKGGSDLALPVRARDANGRVYDVSFLNECFMDYAALKRVTVPDGLGADLSAALLGVPNLAAFTVGGGNARYSARDGVLFAYAHGGYANVLLHYPNGKAGASYDVPDGVEAVSAFAFENGGKAKAVTLSATVAAWGVDADEEDGDAWYAASRLERIAVADGNPPPEGRGRRALHARRRDAPALSARACGRGLHGRRRHADDRPGGVRPRGEADDGRAARLPADDRRVRVLVLGPHARGGAGGRAGRRGRLLQHEEADRGLVADDA